MNMRDLRELDSLSLTREAQRLAREVREVQAAVRLGKEKNHARIRQLKRDLARVKTLL